MVLSVFKSKTVTVDVWPSLTNPRPSSGASAIPWTPRVLGIFPTISAGIHVEHLDLGSMRDVESAGRFIDDEIIPSTLSFDRNLFDDVISPFTQGKD